jgi:hypothetical protein
MEGMLFLRKLLPKYLKGRDHSEDLVVGGGIILQWILEK